MARVNGFTVINTADLFCRGNRANCQPLIGSDVLVIDYAHLSGRGGETRMGPLGQEGAHVCSIEEVRCNAFPIGQ